MARPSDIPESVWTAAENALDDMLCGCIEASGTPAQFRADNVTPIARAIMAAKAEEREACAGDLERRAKMTPLGHESASRGRSTYNWLKYCASQIRKRGEG